jgi:hypothetical protein
MTRHPPNHDEPAALGSLQRGRLIPPPATTTCTTVVQRGCHEVLRAEALRPACNAFRSRKIGCGKRAEGSKSTGCYPIADRGLATSPSSASASTSSMRFRCRLEPVTNTLSSE